MTDFKHLHKSNWPARPLPKWKKAVEEITGGLLIFAMFSGLGWFAVIQYARVHP